MTHTVAHVRTNDEQNVSERLLERGVSSWYPKGTRRVSNGRQRRLRVERPAFPGYLFVDVETITYPDMLYGVAGFYDFLRYQGEWAIISEDKLDEVRAMEARGMFSEQSRGKPRFTIGEVLKVPDGVFGGMTGEVVQHQDGEVWLNGYDFSMAVRISGLKLLRSHVECGA